MDKLHKLYYNNICDLFLHKKKKKVKRQSLFFLYIEYVRIKTN